MKKIIIAFLALFLFGACSGESTSLAQSPAIEECVDCLPYAEYDQKFCNWLNECDPFVTVNSCINVIVPNIEANCKDGQLYDLYCCMEEYGLSCNPPDLKIPQQCSFQKAQLDLCNPS